MYPNSIPSGTSCSVQWAPPLLFHPEFLFSCSPLAWGLIWMPGWQSGDTSGYWSPRSQSSWRKFVAFGSIPKRRSLQGPRCKGKWGMTRERKPELELFPRCPSWRPRSNLWSNKCSLDSRLLEVLEWIEVCWPLHQPLQNAFEFEDFLFRLELKLVRVVFLCFVAKSFCAEIESTKRRCTVMRRWTL